MKSFRVLAAGVVAAALITGGTFAAAHALGTPNTPTGSWPQIGLNVYCNSGDLRVSLMGWEPYNSPGETVTYKINVSGTQIASNNVNLGNDHVVSEDEPIAGNTYTSGYGTIVWPDGHAFKANFPTTPPSC